MTHPNQTPLQSPPTPYCTAKGCANTALFTHPDVPANGKTDILIFCRSHFDLADNDPA